MGVLTGLWISVRNSSKQGIDPDDAWNLGIVAVLAGIVGAKILYFINDWDFYTAHPREIFSWSTMQAAGVFSGGLLAALAASAWYIRKHNMPAMATCDAFSPGLAFGHAIGRLGCFRCGLLLGPPDLARVGSDVSQSVGPRTGGNAIEPSPGADAAV